MKAAAEIRSEVGHFCLRLELVPYHLFNMLYSPLDWKMKRFAGPTIKIIHIS